MRRRLLTCLALFATSAVFGEAPQQVIRIGDGKARATAVAATPDGGALIGIELTASAVPERRENAGVELKAGQAAVAVAAYNANGRLRWSRALTASIGAPNLRAIATAIDGSSCAVGAYTGAANIRDSELPPAQAAGAADAFALGLAPDGVARWLTSFGGTGADDAVAAAMAPGGGCYVAGSFRDAANFGGTVLQSHGGADAFVARVDAAGKVVWALPFGGAGNDEAVALAVAPAGGVYVLLRYVGSVRVDTTGGAREFGTSGADDALVLHIAADGAVSAAQAIGSEKPDHFTALAAAADGVAVIGYYSGAENLSIGERTLALHSAGGADGLVLRLDSALKLDQYTSVGGGNGMLLLLAANYAADGRLWAAGSITGEVRIGEKTVQAERTDGVVLGFDVPLGKPSRVHEYGGERGQQLSALATSGTTLYVAGVTSAVEKSEAEREREEALEREQRKPPAKELSGKAAAERARAEEEEREEARSRSQAVLLRYRAH